MATLDYFHGALLGDWFEEFTRLHEIACRFAYKSLYILAIAKELSTSTHRILVKRSAFPIWSLLLKGDHSFPHEQTSTCGHGLYYLSLTTVESRVPDHFTYRGDLLLLISHRFASALPLRRD